MFEYSRQIEANQLVQHWFSRFLSPGWVCCSKQLCHIWTLGCKELYYLTFITCNWANQIDISLFSFFPILWPTFKASFFPAREKVWTGLVQQCICVWFLILMSSSSYCGLIAHGDAQKWILRGNSCSWQLCDNDVVMGKVQQ